MRRTAARAADRLSRPAARPAAVPRPAPSRSRRGRRAPVPWAAGRGQQLPPEELVAARPGEPADGGAVHRPSGGQCIPRVLEERPIPSAVRRPVPPGSSSRRDGGPSAPAKPSAASGRDEPLEQREHAPRTLLQRRSGASCVPGAGSGLLRAPLDHQPPKGRRAASAAEQARGATARRRAGARRRERPAAAGGAGRSADSRRGWRSPAGYAGPPARARGGGTAVCGDCESGAPRRPGPAGPSGREAAAAHLLVRDERDRYTETLRRFTPLRHQRGRHEARRRARRRESRGYRERDVGLSAADRVGQQCTAVASEGGDHSAKASHLSRAAATQGAGAGVLVRQESPRQGARDLAGRTQGPGRSAVSSGSGTGASASATIRGAPASRREQTPIGRRARDRDVGRRGHRGRSGPARRGVPRRRARRGRDRKEPRTVAGARSTVPAVKRAKPLAAGTARRPSTAAHPGAVEPGREAGRVRRAPHRRHVAAVERHQRLVARPGEGSGREIASEIGPDHAMRRAAAGPTRKSVHTGPPS